MLILIGFILSTSLSYSTKITILYNRLTSISYLSICLFIYEIIDYHYFNKPVELFNGLMYCSLYTLTFTFYMYGLGGLVICLTSQYPMRIENNTLLSEKRKEIQKWIINTYNDLKESIDLPNKSIDKIREDSSTENRCKSLSKSSLNPREINETIFENIKESDLVQTQRYEFNIIEYSLITQFILLGSLTLLSSSDLITVFLAIELQSYGLYILSAIYRNSESSTSAGLTYFLLGGLSSCIILLGQSFIYVNTGTTSLDGIYLIQNIMTSDADLISYFNSSNDSLRNIYDISNTLFPAFTLDYYQSTLQFSFIVMSTGFLFKISAAPFHSWSPGVYDAIPTVTTTFVAIIPKISIFILLFDIIYYTSLTTLDYTWSNIFLFSSFLSLIIGSVLGLTQFRLKRLYAYSTISHVGFLLLGLSIHSVESIQAFFFYIIQYSLSNLNAFLILIAIGYTYVNLEKKTTSIKAENLLNIGFYKEYRSKLQDLSPINIIDHIKGYFYINPMLALSLGITLFSFIGVPPLVGFFAKQMILSSALDNGNIFMCLIAILTSVISAVYYLYIVKHMFFEKSKSLWNTTLFTFGNTKKEENPFLNIITLSSLLSCIISILSLTILLFIFLYHEIYSLVNILSVQIVY